MYNATAKPKDKQHTISGVGSPAPAPITPKGAKGEIASPRRQPVLENRQKSVPPLKLSDVPGQSVITSPDAQSRASSTGSPVKSLSPSKVIRSISEKLSVVAPRIEEVLSPRAKGPGALDSVEWLDIGPSMPTVSSPSPESSPSRKRKATDNREPDDGNHKSRDSDYPRSAKRVRFNTEPQREPIEARVLQGRPGYTKQIDLLAHTPRKSSVPPPRPTTPAPTELTPIKLPQDIAFGMPTLRSGTAANAVGSSANTRRKVEPAVTPMVPAVVMATNKTASSDKKLEPGVLPKPGLHEPAEGLRQAPNSHEAPTSFPFAPDKLGKWAIKQREGGVAWVGKATGKSLAATLQRTLDGLQVNNVGRIDTEACGYLQEMFGLLPAGTEKADNAFNYMLMKSFYSLGLTDAQWDTIEKLYKGFDKLDTRHDPDSCAAFKTQLGEIVGAKNGLVFARQLTEKQASGSINS